MGSGRVSKKKTLVDLAVFSRGHSLHCVIATTLSTAPASTNANQPPPPWAWSFWLTTELMLTSDKTSHCHHLWIVPFQLHPQPGNHGRLDTTMRDGLCRHTCTPIASALMSTRLTALSKKDGKVRGIATGCSLRRLIARGLAKQFTFRGGVRTFQHALSIRAGTDCVGHLHRAAAGTRPTTIVLSVDGNGAFDHVLGVVEAKALLPFVLLSNGEPSTYSWHDDSGERWTVTWAEGRAQGDPLMPLLLSISIQRALEEGSRSLNLGGHFVPFP